MRWIDGIKGRMLDLSLPTLTRDAEIAVYMVHNSADAEDYFFLFDFEEFVERSKGGIFVRPVLKIHAGRDDFSRTQFARHFREVFAAEFDRMRRGVKDTGERRGWLDWNFNVVDLVSDFVATLVLGMALSLGRKIFGQLALPSVLKGKSAEAKLAEEVETTKVKVEAALAAIAVTVHPSLLAHAERHGVRMKRAAVDHDAWPLPDYVKAHLKDGTSGSWW